MRDNSCNIVFIKVLDRNYYSEKSKINQQLVIIGAEGL